MSPPDPAASLHRLALPDVLARLAVAEDTLRAIAAGEVDGFVLKDGARNRLFSLSTADRPYRMFVESMRDGAATLSSAGVILYANRRLAEMLKCTRESIIGSPLAVHIADGVNPGGVRLAVQGGPSTNVELVLRDARGRQVPVLVGSAPLEVDGEDLTCLTFTDLTAQKAQEREIARLSEAQGERLAELQAAEAALTRQATHDALTGLPNRTLLVDRIDQALASARRSGACTAVFFVDLDRFKQVNDTLGHAAGDLVLQAVARRLCSTLRPVDTVARLGGDEFVILTPEVDNHRQAIDISERLLAELLRDAGAGDTLGVAASIGMTVSVSGQGNAETLLHEADIAMYHAKSLGGRRVAVFDAVLGQRRSQQTETQDMIQCALDERRVMAHYQPIFEVAGGRLAGYEALARIRTDGAVLPPSAFISVAETTNQIIPLGTQILQLACEEASRWQPETASGLAPTVAVNLSGRQFAGGDLDEVVRRTLDSGLSPSRLHLELTETAIIDLHPGTILQLQRIRDLGVQIGLDDFGTGYASLTHLRRLPVSFVKIDQSFVHGLETDDEDERIVSAVIELAANLGLRSIAEGVETPFQLDRLRQLGCDQVQGYLMAHPTAAEDLPAAMRARPSAPAHVT